MDSWPHPFGMTSDGKPTKGRAPADKQAEREAKLAQALRANLRRRKAEPKPHAGRTPPQDDGDSV